MVCYLNLSLFKICITFLWIHISALHLYGSHPILYSSNYSIVPTLPPKFMIAYTCYTYIQTFIIYIHTCIYNVFSLFSIGFICKVIDKNRELDDLRGNISLDETHFPTLSSIWPPVPPHPWVGLCEIFLDLIGMPTEVIALSILFRSPLSCNFRTGKMYLTNLSFNHFLPIPLFSTFPLPNNHSFIFSYY